MMETWSFRERKKEIERMNEWGREREREKECDQDNCANTKVPI